MKNLSFLLLFVILISACSPGATNEPKTGPEMIEASIRYHDPENKWEQLKVRMDFEDSLPPHREDRTYSVLIDNSISMMEYSIEGLSYQVVQDSLITKEGEIDLDRALRMRNYYTYLWGLPMKLRDPGTIIEDAVTEEILDGVTYYVVRVPYEKDIWSFYLDQETYRMAAYKFYQDEPNLKGEIIYLEGMQEFNGVKIPANRTWYRTEKPEFLATDKLVKVSSN